jgi:hypothetical protein
VLLSRQICLLLQFLFKVMTGFAEKKSMENIVVAQMEGSIDTIVFPLCFEFCVSVQLSMDCPLQAHGVSSEALQEQDANYCIAASITGRDGSGRAKCLAGHTRTVGLYMER